MAPGAPLVHGDQADRIRCELSIGSDPRRNLAASASGSTGDVARGLAEADAVVERTYTTSKVQCTPVEPHVVYTKMDGERLVIHASTQVPWHLRRIVARALGIRENRIQVIKERIDRNRGKVRVAADLSQKGIADIDAEQRVQKVMADDALKQFEVELGMRSPETSAAPEAAKDLGPATEKATEKQTH